MCSSIYITFYSSRSPNPLKIYHKVFIDLATKYSKKFLNQSQSATYLKPQKRSLSNKVNWGKRLDNEILSKRIWLEETKPEKNSDVQEIPRDDVTSSRLSPIRKSDMLSLRLNRIRILYNHRSMFDLFPPASIRSNDQTVQKTKLNIGHDQYFKLRKKKKCIKQGMRDKRRIGMIQNSPIFEPKEGDDYR